MESNQAAGHLEVIRTLMERSAIYRRALGPVMTLAGTLGTLAAAAGWFFRFETPMVFTGYWLSVGILTALSAFLLTRQQAVKQKEPFLTPPTRRVVHALLPCLLIGFMIGMVLLAAEYKHGTPAALPSSAAGADLTWLPLTWILLYGCALHAASAYTPRGVRWFAWIIVIIGLSTFMSWALAGLSTLRPQLTGHVLMGFFFGVLHLAYGAYLFATERKKGA